MFSGKYIEKGQFNPLLHDFSHESWSNFFNQSILTQKSKHDLNKQMACINHFKMKKFRNNIVFLGWCRATDLLTITNWIDTGKVAETQTGSPLIFQMKSFATIINALSCQLLLQSSPSWMFASVLAIHVGLNSESLVYNSGHCTKNEFFH